MIVSGKEETAAGTSGSRRAKKKAMLKKHRLGWQGEEEGGRKHGGRNRHWACLLAAKPWAGKPAAVPNASLTSPRQMPDRDRTSA
jgi:hypothetical protein